MRQQRIKFKLPREIGATYRLFGGVTFRDLQNFDNFRDFTSKIRGKIPENEFDTFKTVTYFREESSNLRKIKATKSMTEKPSTSYFLNGPFNRNNSQKSSTQNKFLDLDLDNKEGWTRADSLNLTDNDQNFMKLENGEGKANQQRAKGLLFSSAVNQFLINANYLLETRSENTFFTLWNVSATDIEFLEKSLVTLEKLHGLPEKSLVFKKFNVVSNENENNKLVQNSTVPKLKTSTLTLSINRKRPEKQNHAKNAILVYLKESHIIEDIVDFNARHFNDDSSNHRYSI